MPVRPNAPVLFSLVAVVFLTCILAGCGYTASNSRIPAVRTYDGTASVGDFVTISIDSTAGTIAYNDLTSSTTGTVPYTVNDDGSYAIVDPTGNLLAGYELPGDVLLLEAAKAGPGANTPALITAFETTPASISSFAGEDYNFVQFRTTAGGINIGTVSIGAQGDLSHTSYSPMGLIFGGGDQYFDTATLTASSIVEDPSGDFFTITEQDSSQDVVFGTQNGLWTVDTPNGAIMGLPKAAAKDFDPASAGSYASVYYQKINAQTDQNNVETGTPAQGEGSVMVSTAGDITIADGQGNTLVTGALVPVADASYIYNGTPSELPDPCFGLFTVRTQTANSLQDVFVSFRGRAVLFGSFQSALPGQSSNPYTYFYGVGLK
jgi:hypothetical protein